MNKTYGSGAKSNKRGFVSVWVPGGYAGSLPALHPDHGAALPHRSPALRHQDPREVHARQVRHLVPEPPDLSPPSGGRSLRPLPRHLGHGPAAPRHRTSVSWWKPDGFYQLQRVTR